MPTHDDEWFEDNWWKCMEVIESAHECMKIPIHKEGLDEPELRKKWMDKESESCLLGKDHLKSWQDVRKYLWEHYVDKKTDKKILEQYGYHAWESDED